jgi:hypothetical protein
VKAFVSYSWSSQEHENHIMDISERLANDGVNIILDKWDLKEGHDKYAFMERMVTDLEVQKVLIFSDKKYAQKADQKKNGVGTESQIISKEIYDKVIQDKFIPIVFEFKENGEPCLPVFLRNRKYIDFSTPQKENENYDMLLRAIFDQPLYKKPQIGAPPKRIFEKTTSYISGRGSLYAFRKSLYDDKSNYIALARNYLAEFLKNLKTFQMSIENGKSAADTLRANLSDMIKSRDELLEFFDLAFSYKDDIQLFEIILEYLEKSLRYNFPEPDVTSWSEKKFENFRFFNHECFIYLVSFLLHYKRYDLADKLLNHNYYIDYLAPRSDVKLHNYKIFYSYSQILEDENVAKKLKRMNPTADLFKARATNEVINFREFKQSDFILFLRSVFAKMPNEWYPSSLIYANYIGAFELFIRAEIDEGFEALKLILHVSSRDEFKTGMEKIIQEKNMQSRDFMFARLPISTLSNFERICRV